MKKITKFDVFLAVTVCIFVFFLTNRFACLFYISGYTSILTNGFEALNFAFDNYFSPQYSYYVSFEKNVLTWCGVAILAVLMIFTYYWFGRKNFMFGKEHGSARWGTKKDIEPFIDRENPDNNIIFSATEMLSLSPIMSNWIYNRNKNVICVAGSGKGKTRNVAKPNICQLNTSYVITDPKGELLADCGHMLATVGGYRIKVLNLKHMNQSDRFNFFPYIETENDILIVVDNIIANTTSDQAKAHANDDFWLKAENAMLTAIFAYIKSEVRRDEQNMNTVLTLLNAATVREDNEDFVSPLDVLFQKLAQKDPNSLAVYMYTQFKKGAGKTAKSILISLGVRLAPFATKEVRELMKEDELDLLGLAQEKTALFLVVPETYTTFNFIVTILYQLMLERLYDFADQQPNRRCPVPIQIIGDEIANIGHIPNLERYMSTMRSHGISAILIFQTLTQVEAMDKENWKTIVGNCDTFLYLGGKEQTTNEYVSKSLGKMTIDQRQDNETLGSKGSYGRQDSTLGRDLLDPAEMEKIPGDECIVQLSGVEPFKSKKYRLEKHPRYKYLADGGAPSFSYKLRNEVELEKIYNNTNQIITIELDEAI